MNIQSIDQAINRYGTKRVGEMLENPPSPGGNLDDFIAGNMQSVDSELEIIPDFAFAGKTGLQTVDIPNATYVGKYAFSAAPASSSGSGSGSDESESGDSGSGSDLIFNNKNLVTVNMPNVTHIDAHAFEDAENLEISELPEPLTVLENRAFFNCPKVLLESFPPGIVSIGDEALPNEPNLDLNTVPETLEYLGSGVTLEQLTNYFNSFSQEGSAVVDISQIPHQWFEMKISGAITTVRFLNVTLPSVVADFPEGITKFADGVFNAVANQFTDIAMSPHVVSIGSEAFTGCTNLMYLALDGELLTIGEEAFYDCYALQSVNIPNSLQNIGHRAFMHCQALHELQGIEDATALEYIGDRAFYQCSVLENTLTLPYTLTYLGAEAFLGCSTLTSINITSPGLAEIMVQTFYNCTHLEYLTFASDCGVRVINDAAFEGCFALQEIQLPTRLEHIGGRAFYNCQELTSLKIPGTVETIGPEAFYKCSQLTTVDMTEFLSCSVNLGYNAFYAYTRPAGFKIIFASQEILDEFAAAPSEMGWGAYAQYFAVAESEE